MRARCSFARFAAFVPLVCLWLSGCSKALPAAELEKAAAPAQRSPDEVSIAEPSRQFIDVQEISPVHSGSTLTVPAHVEYRNGAMSQVGAPLEGRITAVDVNVSQHVNAGDPLFTLDCPDAASMRAAVLVADASWKEAQAELDRQHRMQREGVGIERDVVAAETKVASADAERARVKASVGSIGVGTGTGVVVRAPIAGVVITRKASPGMSVQRGGDPLVEIGDPSGVWVVADVFERDLPRVRTGETGRASFPSLNQSFSGRIASVGTVVTTNLRTASVFVTLETSTRLLRPGMEGRVEFDTADAGVTLPVDAVLIKDGKDPIVWVQKDRLTFVRRRVVVGQAMGGRVPIVSGLAPGDKVVVRGALLLDGSADQLS